MTPDTVTALLNKALLENNGDKRDEIYRQIEEEVQGHIDETKEGIAQTEEVLDQLRLLRGREGTMTPNLIGILIEQAKRELDPNRRRALYQRIEGTLAREIDEAEDRIDGASRYVKETEDLINELRVMQEKFMKGV